MIEHPERPVCRAQLAVRVVGFHGVLQRIRARYSGAGVAEPARFGGARLVSSSRIAPTVTALGSCIVWSETVVS